MRSVTRSCVVALTLATAVLTACGSKNLGYGDPTGSGLSTVKVTGDFGKAPVVTWTGVPAAPSAPLVQTVITGTGESVPSGTAVKANIYLSDVQSDLQKQALCQAEAKPAVDCKKADFPVTSKVIPFSSANPIELPPTSDANSLVGKLRGDAKLGSRVEALLPASTLAGFIPASLQQQGVSIENYFPGLSIGNGDAVLMVLDFVKLGAAQPKAVDVPASQLPALVLKGGKPTGFTTTGIKTPTRLERVILTEGTGAPVTATSSITAFYLGQAAGAAKPFQGNYGATPLPLNLAGGAIQGWTYGLDGVKVGSRVLLAIPPALAYGASPPAGSGIPKNATLYFVLDVVSAQ